MRLILLFVLLKFCKGENEDLGESDLIIRTSLGYVEGIEYQSVLNGTFFAFHGIPFAKPPTGPLRFMPPLPVDPWEGVLDATKETPTCVSYSPLEQKVTGDEDCLTVDVFTPKRPHALRKHPLPILAYIHGGAFHLDLMTMEKSAPDYIISKNVILVLIRYRVGIFGFLSFGDLTVPGNFGLKDQVLALKWIKHNIESFGGDPQKVTLYGSSAGAASAHLHMLSPLSRGLFHQVIAESGTALSPWVLSRTTIAAANIMGDVYNCSGPQNGPSTELLACLQATNSSELALLQYNAFPVEKLGTLLEGGFMVFSPCIEPPHEEAFLSEEPTSMLESGNFEDVPMMQGNMKRELSIIENGLRTPFLNINYRRIVFNQAWESIKQSFSKEEMEKIQHDYFNGHPLEAESSLQNITRLLEDFWFTVPTLNTINYHLKSNKSSHIYRFVFDFNSEHSVTNKVLALAWVQSDDASHSDLSESYLFFQREEPISRNSTAFHMMLTATQLWENFVTYGNPTPDDESLGIKWSPFQDEKKYLILRNPPVIQKT